MRLKIRQQTRVAYAACVAMSLMTVMVLVAFPTPNQARNAGIVDNWQPFVDRELSIYPLITAPQEISEGFAAAVDPTALFGSERPSSFVDAQHLEAVLGGIDSRSWLSSQSDKSASESARQIDAGFAQFHGVGFPDIRTYMKGKRSPWAPPGPWDPMVAWRSVNDGVSEPIARVRCMGLTPQAVARRADQYGDIIHDFSDRYGLSPHLVKAVITQESCFNNKALSSVGAQGLMQLMPDTARWLKVKDPGNPAQNVRGGIRYLAKLKDEFDTLEMALAAYNAGPGNVRKYNGVPPFAETQAYVVKVQAHYRRYKAAYNFANATAGQPHKQASNMAIGP